LKRIIIALLAMPMASTAAAQDTGPLEVDVVGGIQAPMAIAVPAMPSANGDAAMGRQIAEIISSDLRTTGLFTPLGPGGIAGYSYAEASNPVYATWRSAGAAALVAGYVEGGGTGRLAPGRP
jgi:TolB protein